MQNEASEAIQSGPALSGRAIRALGKTQLWARFSGTLLMGVALLKLIQGGLAIAYQHSALAAGQVEQMRGIGRTFGTAVATVITVAIYCLLGIFALRYAQRLERVQPPGRQPEPTDIAAALGAQHGYWRLQGVINIIGIAMIALLVAVFVLLVLVHAAR